MAPELIIPARWHVSWLGIKDGVHLCQMKKHDPDSPYLGDEIVFISATSPYSALEALADCIAGIELEERKRK